MPPSSSGKNVANAGPAFACTYQPDAGTVAASGAGVELDVERNGDASAPTIDAGDQRPPQQRAAIQLGDAGYAAGGVGEGALHAVDGRRQRGGRRRRVVSRVDAAADPGRGRERS